MEGCRWSCVSVSTDAPFKAEQTESESDRWCKDDTILLKKKVSHTHLLINENGVITSNHDSHSLKSILCFFECWWLWWNIYYIIKLYLLLCVACQFIWSEYTTSEFQSMKKRLPVNDLVTTSTIRCRSAEFKLALLFN